MPKPSGAAHCHKMIAEVAKGIAHEVYDGVMQDDMVFSEWKRQHPGMHAKALEALFVNNKWGLFIGAARATLTGLLNGPADEALKESIMEALCLDATLVRGRGGKMMQLTAEGSGK